MLNIILFCVISILFHNQVCAMEVPEDSLGSAVSTAMVNDGTGPKDAKKAEEKEEDSGYVLKIENEDVLAISKAMMKALSMEDGGQVQAARTLLQKLRHAGNTIECYFRASDTGLHYKMAVGYRYSSFTHSLENSYSWKDGDIKAKATQHAKNIIAITTPIGVGTWVLCEDDATFKSKLWQS